MNSTRSPVVTLETIDEPAQLARVEIVLGLDRLDRIPQDLHIKILRISVRIIEQIRCKFA